MLSYAFSILKQSSIEKVSGEAFDNIHNLFAAILGNGIGQQLKRGLHREYILQHDNLSVVRGKIDIPQTIKNCLNRTHKIACEFDELSENNIFNQILKTTVLLLIKQKDVDSKHKNDLKQKMLFFSNVDVLDPWAINWSQIRFQRNNHTYRILISLCQFILEGMLLSEDAGEHKLALFVDEQRMCKLYEKFILEYYRRHYYYTYASRSNFFDPNNTELAGAIIEKGANSYTSDYNTEGFFGRVQYDFDDKYFVSGSFRRDASSRFHPEHRWGNFWSAGAAWVINRENWFNSTKFDLLKLKVSKVTTTSVTIVIPALTTS